MIKEEFVELTGDFKLAIVLNQMIYWSERVADFDKFIKEEKERMEAALLDSSALDLQNGWIYKTAEELADECMITKSEATMRRYLEKLCECGWLSKRTNPKYRWDKTLQYRVNLFQIQSDLNKMGYFLEGYQQVLESKKQNDESNFQNDDSRNQNESSSDQNDDSNFHNERSNFHGERAIPEITSEITSELKKELEGEAPAQNPFRFFEENGFGVIGSYISQRIIAWCNDLSDELVIEAMKIAIEQDAKKWRFIEAVLKDWDDKQIKTVDQARAYQTKRKNSQSKQFSSRKGKSLRTEKLPAWYEKEHLKEQPSSNVPVSSNGESLEEKRKRLEAIRAQYKS